MMPLLEDPEDSDSHGGFQKGGGQGLGEGVKSV